MNRECENCEHGICSITGDKCMVVIGDMSTEFDCPVSIECYDPYFEGDCD